MRDERLLPIRDRLMFSNRVNPAVLWSSARSVKRDTYVITCRGSTGLLAQILLVSTRYDDVFPVVGKRRP